jgi:CDP-diacylglycerol--glycerol-3-phosphate 3-phosphatidyltransferase
MTPAVRRRLRFAWLRVTVVLFGGAIVARTILADVVSVVAADRWLLVTGAILVYEVGFLGFNLGDNRPERGSIRPTLGVANHVTLLRGGLYAGVAGFLFVPSTTTAVAWVPGVCYGAGAALDAADGALARTTGERTALGEKLDLAFDTLGFLVAPLVGVVWGRLPVWYLAISAARYLYRGGLAWRTRRSRPVFDLPESRVRRPLAALQMAFITLALLPVLPTRVVSPLAAAVVVPSLVVFGRDYLVVTGRLRRNEV